jgi:sugar-specific transcriptional regulator TrmB
MIGPAGAKEISEVSKITRQDIYRVMLMLEQNGIIARVISKPTVFQAIPIRQATEILLERKRAQYNDLCDKTKELVQETEKSQTEQELQKQKTKFLMIPGREAIIQKLHEALNKTERSLEVVTSRQRFSPAILEFKDKYVEALERGVKIRIATEAHASKKEVLEIIQNLKKYRGFEIRKFYEIPEAVISIFDGMLISVSIAGTAHTPSASALWSNDSSLVALTSNYFKNKWKSAVQYENIHN